MEEDWHKADLSAVQHDVMLFFFICVARPEPPGAGFFCYCLNARSGAEAEIHNFIIIAALYKAFKAK